MDEIKGYEIPIHRSLTEQILLGGVPRQIALLNGTLGAAMVIGLHSWIGIPICLFIHVIAVAATKKDPQFFDCFKRHINQKSYYST
ncbi:MAG TPA: conjugal transfer protein [Firmicutes bacterium]|jgi:type IV secretory pathway TrbD component|nr:conjugal transfer protein [Bacillota bacterium]